VAPDDIRSALKSDHAHLEVLLSDVLAVLGDGDREAVAQAWARLDEAVVGHLALEEKSMIPELLKANERAARSILEEHRHVRSRLAELGMQVDLHTVRAAAVQTFCDELRAHARHEDKELYSWAAGHFSPEERKEIVEKIPDWPPARAVRGATAPERAPAKRPR